MCNKIQSWPLKPVTTSGKSSLLDIWKGFELTFVLIIFVELLPIC